MSDAPGLRDSIAGSVVWNGIAQVGSQVLRFVQSLLLARILAPADFGLYGMAALILGATASLQDLGFGSALVQRKDLQDRHCHSVFWVTAGFGVLATLLIAALAPVGAWFFAEPAIRSLLMVGSLAFLANGVAMVHSSLLQRALDFKRISRVELAVAATATVVAVGAAHLGAGVWSFIAADLTGSVLLAGLWWWASPFRPQLRFDRASIRELLPFGANIAGFQFANYLGTNVDYLVVGKRLGAAPLGVYTLAYQLATYPQTRLSTIVTRVTFPAFSSIQNDDQRMRRGYLASVGLLSTLTFPLLVGLASVAPEAIAVLYGDRWIDAVVPLQILCVAGLIYSIGSLAGPILFAKGDAGLALRLTIFLRIGLLGVLVWVGSGFGVIGVACAVSLYALISFWIVQWFVGKSIQLPLGELLAALRPAALASGIMALAVVALGRLLASGSPGRIALSLGLQIAVGALVYAGALLVFDRARVTDLTTTVRQGLSAAAAKTPAPPDPASSGAPAPGDDDADGAAR